MKSLLPILILLFPAFGFGQTPYSMSSIPYYPDPFASGTLITPLGDDQFSGKIPLPFSFCFFGANYDTVLVGSNGYITFNLTWAGSYCIWPINSPAPSYSTPPLSIMGPWQDLYPPGGGSVKFDVRGTAPYRRFIVSYFQVPVYAGACSTLLFSEQIILFETTNIIEIHILDKPVCASWNNGAGIEGIAEDTTNAYIVPGRNYPTQWIASNDAWRFSPAGPCAGPPPPCTIDGRVYIDYNANCVFDNNDAGVANRSVLVNSGTYFAWTDSSGFYSVATDTGTWNVSSSPPLYYAANCPVSGNYPVSLSFPGQSSLNNDFADSVTMICPDLWVDIGTANMTRCNSEFVGISYCNAGTMADSNVVITITLDDSISISGSSHSYTSPSSNVYEFQIGLMNPGQCGQITLSVHIGCDSVGTIYCMNSLISGSGTSDCDTSNNHTIDCHALIASLDPNVKVVAAQRMTELGWVNTDTITATDHLTYMIKFQNTGNDTAITVTIRDTIPFYLNPASFRPGAASSLYNWVLQNDEIIFTFSGINLPDSGTNEAASHGFVKFRIEQNPGNISGTMIHNHASIYFDSNAPVVTNQTTNIIAEPMTGGMNPDSYPLKIYPNPGKENLTVECVPCNGGEFILMNLFGQEITRKDLIQSANSISTTDLRAGLYFYKIVINGISVVTGNWVKTE